MPVSTRRRSKRARDRDPMHSAEKSPRNQYLQKSGMNEKAVIVFDLDGNARAKQSHPSLHKMARLLHDLLVRLSKWLLSLESAWSQFEKQVLAQSSQDDSLLTNLSILPTCGTQFFQ